MGIRIAVAATALFAGVLTMVAAPIEVATAHGAVTSQSSTRAVPTCPGLGRIGTGSHMWRDEHGGSASQLARGIQALICSAADGSTIDIKSWFVTVSGAAQTRIVARLKLMHRYHRVHVNIFVARSWYSASKWRKFRQAVPFARVASCARACKSGVVTSIDHSKWITVSRLRSRNGGGSVVLSTSLNPSYQQFSSVQSGIVVVRNRPVYAAFIREWNGYNRCASGRGCTHHVPVGRWYGYGDTHVWFEPSQADPTYLALRKLDCRHGGTIELMSLYLYRNQISGQLMRLRREGCTVNVLLAHSNSSGARAMQLRPRCALTHDKAVIIHVGRTREVIAGSQDQTPSEVVIDDNQMVRSTNPRVFRDYVRYFNEVFHSRSTSRCTGVGGE